jgi:hypothetical protein
VTKKERSIVTAAKSSKVYEFEAVIQKVDGIDGAFVAFPHDLRAEFGKGRVKVHATFVRPSIPDHALHVADGAA